MKRIALLLFALLCFLSTTVFAQAGTISGISVGPNDTLYIGQTYQIEVYGSGTQFTLCSGGPSFAGSGCLYGPYSAFIDGLSGFDLQIVNDTVAIFTFNMSRGNLIPGPATVGVALYFDVGPVPVDRFDFPVFIKDNDLTGVNQYFDNGEIIVEVTGQNMFFTQITHQAKLLYSNGDESFYTGIQNDVGNPQLGQPSIILNDDVMQIRFFGDVMPDVTCGLSATLEMNTTYGTYFSPSFTIGDCPSIASNTNDLVTGQQIIELTGQNTHFTQGTIVAKLSSSGSTRDLYRVATQVVNDTFMRAIFEYYPDNIPSSGGPTPSCENMELVIYRPFGSFAAAQFNDACYDVVGVTPDFGYRDQPVSIAISGTNIGFTEVTQVSDPVYSMRLRGPQGANFVADSVTANGNVSTGHFNIPFFAPCGFYELYYTAGNNNFGLFGGGSGSNYIDSFLVDCGVNLRGNVYRDLNGNGSKDANEPNVRGNLITALPATEFATTNINGNYFLNTPPGTYDVEAQPLKYHVFTQPSAPYNINLAFGTVIDTLDFGMYLPDSIQDVGISLTTNGYANNTTHNLYLNYTNYGSDAANVVISLELDANITFNNSTAPVDSVVGNTIYWSLDTLKSIESVMIQNSITVDLVPFGTVVTNTAEISSDIADIDLLNNIDIDADSVRAAYDPNDKQVKPNRAGEENLTLFEEDLVYTVRFQNTGDFTAFFVRIEDTLDSYLDYTSMRILAQSHPLEYSLDANGALVFYFNNIMLPDSGTDEPGSHGFVKFSISPVDSLAENTEIFNDASIYFDLNPPILTNMVTSTMVSELPIDTTTGPIDTTSIRNYGDNAGIKVYPNPFKNRTLIEFHNPDNEPVNFRLIDLSGKVVLERKGLKGNRLLLNRGELTTGVYFAEVRGSNVQRAKLLIE